MSFLPNNYSPIEVSIPDENGNLIHFEGNITSTIPGIAAPELKDFIDVPINWGSDAIFDDMKFVDLPFVNIGDFNIKIDSVNPDEIMKTIPDFNQEKK
ncbi:hypothetical protein [Xenorhabdus sp. IM139775]|uniref:hypothetical protein n=1 Tax=Xenorhabdus sp. IM139775 TaxID=3025876 RepID=UPI002359B51A|nr:hypothetical protein [Xenorhabdus sp. IM139775]MDC9593568.1 hypothetical protein [Xenorhabdus sp. IM139775]